MSNLSLNKYKNDNRIFTAGMGEAMIVIVKKLNIALIGLIFLLIIAIYSLGFNTDETASAVAVNNEGRRVVVDAGHGGEDPGAVSDYSGAAEKDIAIKIAFFLKEELEKEGYTVVMTRTEDILQYQAGTERLFDKRKQDLTRRKKIMDEEGEIAVSIHLNKFSQTKYAGAQTFFPPDSEQSRKLASCIQQSLRKNADPENKREALVKKERIIIFRDLKTPTTVVECGFLSHKEEEGKLITEDYQKKIAAAIKTGIDEYFKSK